MEIIGTWFDGRDSRPRQVRLSSPEPGWLQLDSDEVSLQFAIADIAISPRLGSTARTLRLPDHGHVECADTPALGQLFSTPSRVEALADWLERRRVAVLVSAIATIAGVVLFFQVGLPWGAAKIAPRIPARVEQMMSHQVLSLLDRIELKPTKLPIARQSQLRAEFATLVRDLPRERDMRLQFRRAPRLGANAFALPDGTIVMTDELVALAANDDEIIAVLAHEVGHHEHRHALRQTLESSGILVVTTLLLGDVSGSSLTVTMPTVLLETGFSRGHEREADEFGFKLLRSQGRSPKTFADILRKLVKQKPGDDSGDAIGYISTHPSSEQRIRRAEQAAREPR